MKWLKSGVEDGDFFLVDDSSQEKRSSVLSRFQKIEQKNILPLSLSHHSLAHVVVKMIILVCSV